MELKDFRRETLAIQPNAVHADFTMDGSITLTFVTGEKRRSYLFSRAGAAAIINVMAAVLENGPVKDPAVWDQTGKRLIEAPLTELRECSE